MLNVLIIDDNKAFTKMLSQYIAWDTLDMKLCATAYQGKQGLTAIRKYHPDLVITDINMPGMDGLEMMEQAQEIVPNARFILITAHDDFQYAYRAIKQQAFDYLLKPCTREELQRVLERASYELLSKQEKSDSKYPPIVREVIVYIKANLSQSVTLEKLSEEFHVSESNISRNIKKFTGLRYSDLLIKLRMEEAKHLLDDPYSNITEIAERVGYKNYISFYKVFVRSEGISPSAFRKGTDHENP